MGVISSPPWCLLGTDGEDSDKSSNQFIVYYSVSKYIWIKASARKWLHHRSQEQWSQADLTNEEIDWIMEEEKNETCLLCYRKEEAAAFPGAQDISKMSPASGGGEWWIKEGNVITLPELLWGAKNQLSAFDIYNISLCLPVYCYKKSIPSPSPRRRSGIAMPRRSSTTRLASGA